MISLFRIAMPLVVLLFGNAAWAGIIYIPEDLKEQPQSLPNLRLYAPHWCPHCKVAEKEIQEHLPGRFNIFFHKDHAGYPQWVTDKVQEPGWGFPLVHWTDYQGNGHVMIWPGIEVFKATIDNQIRPLQLDAAPRQFTSAVEQSAAPTPGQEVERVIGLLPKPTIGFVDFGCGDARWCIAAAERFGCRCTGVEIDPARAAAARERVRALGLSHLITIVEGDATQVDVQGDVACVYLYSDVLEKLRPRLEKMRAVASYMHRPPGLPVVQNGNTWLYFQAVSQPAFSQPRALAVWHGQSYSQPVCSNPGCAMCRSIRQQLNQR